MSLQDIKRSDPGEKLTAVTSAEWCPCRRCFGLKFLVLQMMTVWSAELVASHFESGLNAQHKTLSSCPISVCWWAPTNGFLDEDPPMFTNYWFIQDHTPGTQAQSSPTHLSTCVARRLAPAHCMVHVHAACVRCCHSYQKC